MRGTEDTPWMIGFSVLDGNVPKSGSRELHQDFVRRILRRFPGSNLQVMDDGHGQRACIWRDDWAAVLRHAKRFEKREQWVVFVSGMSVSSVHEQLCELVATWREAGDVEALRLSE